MVAVKPLENPRYRVYRPEADPTCLGLLVAEPMAACGPFHIYGPCGLVRAAFQPNGGRLAVNSFFLEQARAFHTYACEQVLQVIFRLLSCVISCAADLQPHGSAFIGYVSRSDEFFFKVHK
jgi:hypothetical protein